MNKIQLKIHRWEFGVLKTVKMAFETVENALEYSLKMIDKRAHFLVKIFDENGELVHWDDHKPPCDDDNPY